MERKTNNDERYPSAACMRLSKTARHNPQEGSYTCYLFEKGLDKILKKCGEECSEMIIAAKNQGQ